jgi:translation initiation factor IF-1
MGREMLSVLLALLFFIEPAYDAMASQTPQERSSQKTTLQQKVLEIPAGTLVEVRLKNKEILRGRLGEVHEAGFDVQVAAGDKVEARTIAFDELKSIKKAGGGGTGRFIGHVALGTAIVIGVLILTGVIMAAASS